MVIATVVYDDLEVSSSSLTYFMGVFRNESDAKQQFKEGYSTKDVFGTLQTEGGGRLVLQRIDGFDITARRLPYLADV